MTTEIKLPVMYHSVHHSVRKKVREAYVLQQNGLCHHCGEPLSGDPSSAVQNTPVNKDLFPPNFFAWPIHLHHSHETGLTIGAVHNYCNAVLWEHHGE